MAPRVDQVNFIVADLDLFTRQELIRLSVSIDANLRESPPGGTPVDTGWARANWVPSVGEPAILDGSNSEPTEAEIAARQKIADAGTNEVLAWKPADGAIFNTNNVPYIQALNDGHSSQSPPGFVQFAVEKAIKETYSAGAQKAARNRRAAAGRAGKARPR